MSTTTRNLHMLTSASVFLLVVWAVLLTLSITYGGAVHILLLLAIVLLFIRVQRSDDILE